ncbi:MAG: GyrI-like domain-containing protein [Eudoraea sp.]|nr:GyrI-like domain-containing protein [Eudoraea sp.]NNJ40936.1 GyrI-like domain-containing protein [Eudoraea sp.]
MAPRIITSRKIQLVGLKRTMSLSQNQTRELWQSFMPEWKAAGLPRTEFYSVEVYPEGYFASFDPNKDFDKWAAVLDTADFPALETWDTLEVPAGLYAVFTYKGKSTEVHKMYQYIIGTWVPNSEYQLDNRPHMGIMGEKYRNDDPESEEELWVPVKK